MELLPRAAEAIARLNARGVPVIVITNQSGIGRGRYTEADFRAVQGEAERKLAMQGCALDGVYFCPHAPDREPPCDCRKPAPRLYREAAERFGISLDEAFFVGDRLADVLPARPLGARGFLLRPAGPREAEEIPAGCRVVADLWEAVEVALGEDARADAGDG